MGRRRFGALALAAVLATGLAACGDDDDGGDVSLEDGSDDGSSGDTSDDSGDSGDAVNPVGEGIFAEGCGEFASVFSALGASIGAAFGEVDDEALGAFQEAIDDAPEEIRDDLETFAGAYEEYGEALQEAGVDFSDPGDLDASTLAALAELGEVFSDPEVVEAGENINDFMSSGCET